ncbi:hypothetical protein J4464_06460 [Candidatus Woesearchaeota archaeon]|nr:hypothetical protein [Candidatus Woesearchaeota archaeon]
MKHKITLGIFALILTIIVISGCAQKVEIPSEPTSQFDIYYSSGVGEKNILDTKNNRYVKDMVCDPLREYTVQLTESEKTVIYASIVQNDLFNVKDEFTKNCDWRGCRGMNPLSTITLKITVDEKTKTIKWSADYINMKKDPEVKRFLNVTNTIRDIIVDKENEMNIEKPKCGYL